MFSRGQVPQPPRPYQGAEPLWRGSGEAPRKEPFGRVAGKYYVSKLTQPNTTSYPLERSEASRPGGFVPGQGSFRIAGLSRRKTGGRASRIGAARVAPASPDTSSLHRPNSVQRQAVHSPSWISAVPHREHPGLTLRRQHGTNGPW